MNARTRGFALVAVLILVALIALLGSTYARHVTLANRSSSATVASMRAAGAVDSGLAHARQLLRTSGPAAAAALADGGSLAIADLGSGHSRLHLRSVDSHGFGSTLLFEVDRVPFVLAGEPDELPRIRADLVPTLLANAALPQTWISGLTTIQDADLEGLVIIQDGAVLTLDGVCVRGAIVSARTMTALDFGPYDVISAPTLIVAGDLRVLPRPELPGIAVVIPDGNVLTTTPSARLQLDGDVVAHMLVLTGTGSLSGNAASVAEASIAAAIQRPGSGRAPRSWAAGLDPGAASEVRSLAALPRVQAPADVPAILGFTFDAP